jgi:hypothetical protein
MDVTGHSARGIVALLVAAVLVAGCGGDDGGAPVADSGSDEAGAAAGDCAQMSEFVEPSEVAEAFATDLQPAGALDGNELCLVQLEVGVVAIAVETTTEEEAAEGFQQARETVAAAGDASGVEELRGIGDEAFSVAEPPQVFVLSGDDRFVVADTGSLRLDAGTVRDGLVAVAEIMARRA